MNLNRILVLLSLLVIAGDIHSQTTKKSPNIIYILADDLGYGDLSCYNENSKIPTPNLDKLASEGVKFTDAHTTSSVCTPTRYSIITGRYNWRSSLKRGVLGGHSKALIPKDRATVASMLSKQGYQTAFIGKWHLGWDWKIKDTSIKSKKFDYNNIDYSKPVENSPNDLGFDYAYGHCGSLDMPPYVYVENSLPTMVPDTITKNKEKASFWREGPTSRDFVHDDVTPNFVRRANNYIKEKAVDEKPFFLYLPLPSPHTPILPTKEWKGKSGINDYADFVMMVDYYMGTIFKTIKEAGIEENTIVIFTSDNGCSPRADFKVLAEKGHNPSGILRGHKADIFEGGHRVPFIVKWPEVIKKDIEINETICLSDFMATCADITNYKLSDNEAEDSFSLLPLLEDKKSTPYNRESTIHHSINGSFAIRKGDWKLIMCPDSGGWSYPRPGKDKELIKTLPKIQLYNLTSDPSENNNLQADNPEKVSELKTLLTKQILEGRSTPGVPQKNDEGTKKWKQIDFTL